MEGGKFGGENASPASHRRLRKSRTNPILGADGEFIRLLSNNLEAGFEGGRAGDGQGLASSVWREARPKEVSVTCSEGNARGPRPSLN
jgi:hypothetical protein